jgi:hypothetical protein
MCSLPPRAPAPPASFFLVASPDRFRGTMMPDYAPSTLHVQKIAVVTDGGEFAARLDDAFSAE